MMRWLNSLWYHKVKWYHYPLVILSGLYRLITSIRRCCYRLRIFKVSQFSVPVIVVGNISVGGTGKTPFVLWLVEQLQQLGYRPGIVSRGYKAAIDQFPRQVQSNDQAACVGDEPLMLCQKSGVPVVIDPKRPRGVEYLIDHCNCNLVISDDGLQHYAMSRDIEIVIKDADRQFGNGYCLPLGPLREPLGRLRTVNYIVANGCAGENEYAMQLQGNELVNIADSNLRVGADFFTGRRIYAFAGIGNPERFFQQLESLGLTIIRRPVADHYNYTSNDFSDIEPDAFVMMTEKDAVKCQRFSDKRFFSFPVVANVSADLLPRLKSLL